MLEVDSARYSFPILEKAVVLWYSTDTLDLALTSHLEDNMYLVMLVRSVKEKQGVEPGTPELSVKCITCVPLEHFSASKM